MIEIAIKIIVAIAITALGMIGGQCKKWTRRYIMPSLASAYTVLKRKKARYKGLFLLSLIGFLSMGYGEGSWLRNKLGGSDVLTRIVYGALLSIPFWIVGKWWAGLILPGTFLVRAGSFKVGKYDWLWEDFIRYGSLGILVVL